MAGGRGRQAIVVVDLGFGDAGKGLVTDFLVRESGAHTVVRFNGGAQAGHNVVTADGRHHTFAQLGAGSFVPGVRTHLARPMVVHPLALLVEARRLAAAGVPDALERLTVSEAALAITPFQQAASRLRELARGASRHGSCGVGVGEAVRDALRPGGEALRMRDLGDLATLVPALRRLQAEKRAELDEALRALAGDPAAEPERRALESPEVIDAWVAGLAPLRALPVVVDDAHLGGLLRAPGAVVFEGAQGVLLDEWRGFHPHTTWSTCTFDNALELLHEHGHDGEVTRLGVLRAYATRHGEGPFPTEAPELGAQLAERHNGVDAWQGPFRRGWLDPVLARYAVAACGGVDRLAVTHLDALEALRGRSTWPVCRAYRFPGGAVDERLFVRGSGALGEAPGVRLGPSRDLAHQEALARALFAAQPLYDELALGGGGEAGPRLLAFVAAALGAPVGLASSGPAATDARLEGEWLTGSSRRARRRG